MHTRRDEVNGGNFTSMYNSTNTQQPLIPFILAYATKPTTHLKTPSKALTIK